MLIVIIILLLLVFGTFPAFPYSRSWGYYPAGGLGTILLIVVILWLLHVIWREFWRFTSTGKVR